MISWEGSDQGDRIEWWCNNQQGLRQILAKYCTVLALQIAPPWHARLCLGPNHCMPSSHQLRSSQPAVLQCPCRILDIEQTPHCSALQPKTECDGLDESSGLRLHNPGQTACTGRGLVTTGPAMIAGPGVSDRACAQCHRAESSVSAGEAGDGHWTRTQPAARASSPARCAQAAQARVSVTPVSVTQHSPARPQVTQPVTRAQLLRAGQPREIESHSNPLSASSQIWHPPVLRLRRLSIQCVLITEESVRHWSRVSLGHWSLIATCETVSHVTTSTSPGSLCSVTSRPSQGKNTTQTIRKWEL